uniref:Secreted protein n=1 Tax=Streptomyces sp. NBC_00003 TaxID=2903608 RepID=A0AAU2VGT4_9ACTN
MRTARRLTSALLASAAVLGPAGSLAYAIGEPGGGGGSLELWPTSASPGTTVTANTAACGSAGRATGDANTVGAGDFPMSAATHKEVIAGQFQVASHAKPGSFRIRVSCENGKVVDAQLTVAGGSDLDRDRDQRGNDKSWDGSGQGGKEKPGDGNGQWSKDKSWDGSDQRGKDKPWDGNGQGGKDKPGDGYDQRGKDKPWDGNDQRGKDKPGDNSDPRGHVKTGVGGSVGPDTTEIAVGAAVLAAAAVGGTWLLRRRASGAQGRG